MLTGWLAVQSNPPLPDGMLSQCGPEVISTSPSLLTGEHNLPMNKMTPVVCSLIRTMKGRETLNSGGILTATNTTPVTAAASEPVEH